MRAGNEGEDLRSGHSLMADPDCRELQQRFAAFAQRNLPLLKDALRNSNDEEHRAMAAYIIGSTAKNAIVATALNPLIGYLSAADLVKDAMRRNLAIRDVAAERIERGALTHQDSDKPVTLAEIDALLGDLHKLTEGGLGGPAGGG